MSYFNNPTLWYPQYVEDSKKKGNIRETGPVLISPEEAAEIVKREAEQRARVAGLQEDIKRGSNPDRYEVERRGERWTLVEPDKNPSLVEDKSSNTNKPKTEGTEDDPIPITEPAVVTAQRTTPTQIIQVAPQQSDDDVIDQIKAMAAGIQPIKDLFSIDLNDYEGRQLKKKILQKMARDENSIVGGIYYNPILNE